MKVLHLYSGNLYGGVERMLVTLARERHLCPEMEPSFGLCFRGRLWDELEATGVPLFDLGPVRFSRPWTVWRARRRLANFLHSHRQIVAVHGCWIQAAVAPTLLKTQSSFVHFVHDYQDGKHPIQRLAARTPPKAIIANSRFTARSAEALFGQQATVVYPPLGPPTQLGRTREEIRRELQTPADSLVVAMIARWDMIKGHRVLVEALAELKQNPTWRAWIVGGANSSAEKALQAEIREQIRNANLEDRVHLLGHRQDCADLLAAADIYCQPNTGPEGYGLTFLEALQAGLPVITSGLGGATEIVTPDCGILTPANDVLAVSRTLEILLEDTHKRSDLGAAARLRAEEVGDVGEYLAGLAGLMTRQSNGRFPRLHENDRCPCVL